MYYKRNEREGLVFTDNTGEEFVVVEYKLASDVIIRWKNGETRSRQWGSIIKGCVTYKDTIWWKKTLEGVKFDSKSGSYTILEYINSMNVVIRWDSGYNETKRHEDLKKDRLIDPSTLFDGLLFGEMPDISVRDKKLYKHWRSVINRVAKSEYYRDTYLGEDFRNYVEFEKKAKSLVGCHEGGFQIDKDLLCVSNGIKPQYTLDFIAFVPQCINTLMREHENKTGLPVGVCERGVKGGRFYATFKSKGKRKADFLGTFDTPEEAFQAYITAKKSHARELAEEYKDRLDERIYAILQDIPIEGWDFEWGELKDARSLYDQT